MKKKEKRKEIILLQRWTFHNIFDIILPCMKHAIIRKNVEIVIIGFLLKGKFHGIKEHLLFWIPRIYFLLVSIDFQHIFTGFLLSTGWKITNSLQDLHWCHVDLNNKASKITLSAVRCCFSYTHAFLRSNYIHTNTAFRLPHYQVQWVIVRYTFVVYLTSHSI